MPYRDHNLWMYENMYMCVLVNAVIIPCLVGGDIWLYLVSPLESVRR